MRDTALDFESIVCFICGTDHGGFIRWDGPACCESCSHDLYLGEKKIKAIDTSRGNASLWLEDGSYLEFTHLKEVRGLILEGNFERQRVAAARKLYK